MANKKLYQMNWDGGQTDGDQTPNTVKRLLNVEPEEFGKLRPRDTLAAFAGGLPGGRCAYMSHNPSTAHDVDGWYGFVTSTGLVLIGQVEGELIGLSVGLGADDLTTIDDQLSEIAVYGDKFFLSAVDSDNVPLGAYIVMVPKAVDRFKAPTELSGTQWDGGITSSGQSWTIQRLEMNTPILSGGLIVAIEDDEDYSFAQYKSNFDTAGHENEVVAGIQNGLSQAGAVGVGVLGWFSTPENDYWPEPDADKGLYGVTAEVSLKVQYVYHGGQVSHLSNAVRFASEYSTPSGWDDNEQSLSGFSFGLTVVLPDTLDPLVKGINVYRKNNVTGNPELDPLDSYYLVMTTMVDNESLTVEDEEMGTTQLRTDPRGDAIPEALNSSSGNNNFYGGWALNHVLGTLGPLLSGAGTRPQSVHEVTVDGTFYKTVGWARCWTNYRMYCDLHYGYDGTMMYRISQMDPNLNYTTRSMGTWWDILGASDKYGVSSKFYTTMIRSGATLPLVKARNVSDQATQAYLCGQPSSAGWNNRPNQEADFKGGGRLHPDTIAAFDLSLDNSSVEVNSTHEAQELVFPEGEDSDGLPYIMRRDTGRQVQDTEYSFNGMETADLVKHKPRHMAIAGGRFIGLSGQHGSAEYTTRAWYSQYQKFGMFHRESYMDYGARDDGVGTGLSAFRGTALFHFSSATYIVDVSGGFDMAWRELGAYTNIGLLHSRALTETPLGVFWGDRKDIYWFNGRTVENVSHMDRAKRTIRDTYRGLVDSDSSKIRFNYRADLRQVWVSYDSTVLVLDIDRMAWHEHDLGFGAGFDVNGIFDVEGQQVAMIGFLSDVGPVYENWAYHFKEDVTPNFEWGVEFDYDASVPEVVKKAKRFYVDIVGTGSFEAVATGDHGSEVSQIVRGSDEMIRFSASVRGRGLRLSLMTREVERWRGTIESVGMSHKTKRLK